MMIKASGRSALILATGLFVCFAGPSHAAASADGAATASKSEAAKPESSKSAHASRHWKKVAHRKSSKVALKSAAAAKPDAADDDSAADNSTALPATVANANAQLASASADTPAGNAKAMTARANNILQTTPDNSAGPQPANDTQVVSADQLNDLDRALHESTQPAPTVTMASAEVPTPAAPVLASSNENSTWDQTSLIGKIFIGFGALLTMASAARMFMA
jgi:hypothetical protein